MSDDRRTHQRVSRPLEGTWRGASGSLRCRIGDLSLGGCFVQSLSNPDPGESTVVSLNFRHHEFSLKGEVIYSEPGMGFAIRFKDVRDDELKDLVLLIEALHRGDDEA